MNADFWLPAQWSGFDLGELLRHRIWANPKVDRMTHRTRIGLAHEELIGEILSVFYLVYNESQVAARGADRSLVAKVTYSLNR